MSFGARWIDPKTVTAGNLAVHVKTVDPTPPRSFAGATLFIDDTSAPALGSCILQPFTSCPSTDLSGARLGGAILIGAILDGADFTGADLTDAELAYADLVGADLAGTDLYGAALAGADLHGAIFCNTTMPCGGVNNSGC